MRRLLASLLLMSAAGLEAGSVYVTGYTDPHETHTANGFYSGFGDGMTLEWSQMQAYSTANTVVLAGVLRCDDCGGGDPARFIVNFQGSDFSTVNIDFQGLLSSIATPPDVWGVLYGSVHTVVYAGDPPPSEWETPPPPPVLVADLTATFGFDNPTSGKVILASHPATGIIPPGNFYGVTTLTIESLKGELDFRDPLTNQFAATTESPEPQSLALLGVGFAAVILKRRAKRDQVE